ncbi:hypothetical protein [Cupriavidus campinensis]
MVAAAVVGGAVVGGIASNVASSNAADTAADAQQQAADTGAAAQLEAARLADKTQRYMYDTSRQDYLDQIDRTTAANAPFLLGGQTAVNRLGYLLGTSGTPTFQNQAANEEVKRIMAANNLSYSDAADRVAKGWNAQYDPQYGVLQRNFTQQDFYDDPVTQLGFQFGLDEGTKGLNRAAAANGGLDSGATLKALTRYATDYTGTKANDSYNRYQTNNTNTFNRLASLAGVGQTASNTNASANGSAVGGIASAGANAANNISQNALYSGNAAANAAAATGNARASSAIARGNGWSNAIGTGVNALSGYLQYGGGNNPYGNYSATSYPVQDYYSGVNGTPLA